MKKVVFVFAIFLLSASLATAQTQAKPLTYVPLEPLPCPKDVPKCESGQVQFNQLLAAFFRIMITFGGMFAVVMLVIAGIGYMLSESPLKTSQAKERAQAALWGLLLLAGSWLILSAINPQLLTFKLFIPNAPSSNAPANPTNQQTQTTNQGGVSVQPNSAERKAWLDDANADCASKGNKEPSITKTAQNQETYTCVDKL